MPERKLIDDAPFPFLLLRALGLLSDSGRWGSELSPKGSWAGKPLPVRDAAFLPGLQRGLPTPRHCVLALQEPVLHSPEPPLASQHRCLQEVFNFPGCNLRPGNLYSFILPIHPSTHTPAHSFINQSFANIECF